MPDPLKRIERLVGPWVEPFRRTGPQRDAARMLGRLGLGSLGFGSMAAALMMARRKNERKLLDEEKAKAMLPIPVYVQPGETGNGKSASVRGKAIATGLGLLGLGTTAAGIAYGNDGRDGRDLSNPAARVFNTATGMIPGGGAIRAEQQRYLDLPGTIRGEHAKSFANVPWFVPGALGVSLLGLGAGYGGVNAAGDFLAKRRLERKKRKAKKVFDEALRNEQQSKLGAALEEFVTACEEAAPTIKESSLLEWYLALLGTAGVAGGMAGAYNGYQGAAQKHRLSALKRIRRLQLAKRRNEELSLVPEIIPLPGPTRKSEGSDQSAEKSDESEERAIVPSSKSADLVRSLAKGLFSGARNLGGKAMRGTGTAARQAAKVPPYLIRKQPVTTATIGGLGAAEGLGRLDDRYPFSPGDWKPSNWIFNRFAENQPLRDSNGSPIRGTRRLYSADPNDHAEMKWSWNPFSERGFGWRFRREEQPRRRVLVTDARAPITELVKKTNPTITMRRRMNERFYDYEPR